MCNGITCWLSIVDAFNFNVWFRACMSNYTPLFYNEVILIHVLTPVLGWQISVCKRNPFWRISGSGIEPLPALLMAFFSIGQSGANLNDVWGNVVRKTSVEHGGFQDYFRLDNPTTIRTGDVQVNDNGSITWKRFSRYWSSVRGIHRLPVDHIVKGQRYMYSSWYLKKPMTKQLSCTWFETQQT